MRASKRLETSGIKRTKIPNTKNEVSSSINKIDKRDFSQSDFSYDIFSRAIKRANNLVKVSENSKLSSLCEDSLRAAVVLSISALDAYIRTLVSNKITSILTDSSGEVSSEIRNYVKSIVNNDLMLDAARKYTFKDIVEKAIREDFELKSFQGENRIDFYMKLIGYPDVFETISRSANISCSGLKSDIHKFTKRRHIIAHCGDFDLSNTMLTENAIDKVFTIKCIKVVSTFAEHLHKVVSK